MLQTKGRIQHPTPSEYKTQKAWKYYASKYYEENRRTGAAGRWKQIEDHNETTSDSRAVSASMPDLEGSTRPPVKIKLKMILNMTMSFLLAAAILFVLQIRNLCDTVRKYLCADCYSIFLFLFHDNIHCVNMLRIQNSSSGAAASWV